MATPADLGSSRTLDKPGGGESRIRDEKSSLKQVPRLGTANIGVDTFSMRAVLGTVGC